EHEGHLVRGVESGAEALGAVRDFGADVVLLDIDMPGMTGFAVARSMGFDHYVAKPYSPNEVLAPAGRQTSFEMTGKYSVV
ncbi:MAG: hypothetical protein JO292_02920, partial [Betaproteobacteria bacterium]|nr:hypothetical protein [Betaproteobacteria bacterium]MBV9360321.1 hypothetical protein [Betaproteobacteria bacterium]